MSRSFKQLSAQELSKLDGWYRKGTSVPEAHAKIAQMRDQRGVAPPNISSLYKARKDGQTAEREREVYVRNSLRHCAYAVEKPAAVCNFRIVSVYP